MLTVLISLVLLIASAILIAGHLTAWRTADHGGLGATEREFHARRFRRRFQASIMLGVIGLLLLLGDLWLDKLLPNPLARLLYWLGVLVLLLWMLLLTAGDWLASRAHYQHELNRLQMDGTVLQAELDRLRREENERSSPQQQLRPPQHKPSPDNES